MKFLSFACEGGPFGEDGNLLRKDYEAACFGLASILDGVAKSFEEFYEHLNTLYDEERAPEPAQACTDSEAS